MSDFETSFQRPDDYFDLSPESQWAIDKSLGILDWEGKCSHGVSQLCPECRKRWDAKYKDKK